ncbi:MAG: class I adenylate-forming enzyme family protein [Syntrophales bacterium]|nr:class I adenylate-forming enzyme family protein [Syntrophales bacterium]
MAKFPNKIAIIDDYGQLTYQQFKDQSDLVAANLRSHGIGRGDVVTIQLPNWKEFAIAVYAISRIGAICMPISTNYRLHDAGSMIQRAGAKALILPANFLNFDFADMAIQLQSQVESLEHVWVVGEGDRHGLSSWSDLMKPVGQPVERAGKPDDVALLFYSSGTTGVPKGVMHSHSTFIQSYIRSLTALNQYNDTLVGIVVVPAMLSYGIVQTSLHLHVGGTVILCERYKIDRMVELILQYGINHLPLVPPHVFDLVKYVEEHPEVKIATLKTILASGAATPPALLKKVHDYFGAMIQSAYGLSEHLAITCTIPDTPIELVSTTIGVPMHPATEIDILDNSGNRCPTGVTGEITSRGPELFLGYYGQPELTASVLTPDGWFRTGDLGFIGDDGYLRIVGRKKEMIIRGGLNIDPKEIEELLEKYPKVAQVAIIGMPDERLGEKVCACIIPKSQDQAPTMEEINSFLREKGLSSQKLPQQLEIMKEFPMTATFKVRKTIIRDDLVKKVQNK